MTAPRTIEFFFDIGSPYSYLAATQVEGLAARTGWPVRWRPFLLGGVFKIAGNEMPARVPNKARYMIADLQAWATLYGVPIQMSSHFPISSLRPQRALVAAGELGGEAAIPPFAMALYHAYWVEDRDVSGPEAVAEIAGRMGLDGAAILEAAERPAVKEALRTATEEAVARGAFGAPTFFVGETMFWGNDRIVLLEAHVKSMNAAS